MIIRGQLLAREDDILGYKTLVFKNLEKNCPFGHQYCMLTVFPNWQSYIPDIGEIGLINFDSIKAGDEYYNRHTETIMKYNFTNDVFIKFVKEEDNSKKDIII